MMIHEAATPNDETETFEEGVAQDEEEDDHEELEEEEDSSVVLTRGLGS